MRIILEVASDDTEDIAEATIYVEQLNRIAERRIDQGLAGCMLELDNSYVLVKSATIEGGGCGKPV